MLRYILRAVRKSATYHNQRNKSSISDEIEKHIHLVPMATSREQEYLPRSQYGGRHIVSMITGHGVGPELCNHVLDMMKFLKVPIDFDYLDKLENEPDIQHALASAQRNGCILKYPIGSLNGALFDTTLFSFPNTMFRLSLDMHANLVVFRSFKNIPSRYKDIDIVIIRQNTEGAYTMLEHMAIPNTAESIKVCTVKSTTKTARFAYRWAAKNNRKKVTIAHKANIMKLSDGLFKSTFEEISKDYPNIKTNTMIIDNLTMQLVSKPHQFDIIVCPNLYGNVLCSILSAMLGSPGLVPGSNYGKYYALFEPSMRTVNNRLKGTNSANPTAMFLAARDMLYYLDLNNYADILNQAVMKTIEEDKVWTPDLKGTASTTDIINQIKRNISEI